VTYALPKHKLPWRWLLLEPRAEIDYSTFRASSCVASDGIALVMLVMLGSIVGQHKTGRSLLTSLRQRKACCSSSIQCNTRRDTGAASVATCIKSTISLLMQVLSKSINQSTNQYIQCPGGQLGPNRQQAQFAFYMQSIP